MNNKEKVLKEIVDVVVLCCATEISEGRMSLTREDVLGNIRRQNVIMTRCMLVQTLIAAGYSTTTVAQLLNKSEHSVRHLNDMAYDLMKNSRAYRIANAEVTLRCRDIGQI